jgi:hypothetical protein
MLLKQRCRIVHLRAAAATVVYLRAAAAAAAAAAALGSGRLSPWKHNFSKVSGLYTYYITGTTESS